MANNHKQRKARELQIMLKEGPSFSFCFANCGLTSEQVNVLEAYSKNRWRLFHDTWVEESLIDLIPQLANDDKRGIKA